MWNSDAISPYLRRKQGLLDHETAPVCLADRGCFSSKQGLFHREICIEGHQPNTTSEQQTTCLIDQSRYYPRQSGGVAGSEEGPTPCARLVLDGYDSGDAREIEQHEEQIAEGSQGCDTIGLHLLS